MEHKKNNSLTCIFLNSLGIVLQSQQKYQRRSKAILAGGERVGSGEGQLIGRLELAKVWVWAF